MAAQPSIQPTQCVLRLGLKDERIDQGDQKQNLRQEDVDHIGQPTLHARANFDLPHFRHPDIQQNETLWLR